jgi:microcystin-dependent protein
MSELKMFAFGLTPRGWAACNGQFLPINQNQALFSLLGTTYGGNGQTTFALPDLRDRVPVHMGGSIGTQGTFGGEAAHTLTLSEMPAHNHFVNADSDLAPTPGGNVPATNKRLAGSRGGDLYGPAASITTLQPASIGNFGGSQAHTNLMPQAVVQWCIALQGVFPSRN